MPAHHAPPFPVWLAGAFGVSALALIYSTLMQPFLPAAILMGAISVGLWALFLRRRFMPFPVRSAVDASAEELCSYCDEAALPERQPPMCPGHTAAAQMINRFVIPYAVVVVLILIVGFLLG